DVDPAGSRRPRRAATAAPGPVPDGPHPRCRRSGAAAQLLPLGRPGGGRVPHQRQARGPRPGEPMAAQPCGTGFGCRGGRAPRGDFYLTDGSGPVVLISAGIGITPILAMLHALSAAGSAREIWWLHTTRSHETQAFATEVTNLIDSLPHARQLVFFTQKQGRLDRAAIADLRLPPGATA